MNEVRNITSQTQIQDPSEITSSKTSLRGRSREGVVTYSQQPTVSAKAKRDALLHELRTGRKIPCYEMVSIAGLQYGRAVYEIRWNIGGCVQSDRPKGLEHGLNVQNDNPDPARPDRTVFWLAPGCWTKPVRVGSNAANRVTQEVRAVIDRNDFLETRQQGATLFGDISADRSYRE